MITTNDKLGYQVNAKLADMRKAGSLDSVQYRELHAETVVRFGSLEPDALSSALQAVYDTVEQAYTDTWVEPEIPADAIPVDRDTLIRTVKVLQTELKAGRIGLDDFNQLNAQRRGYFYLVSVGCCGIPRDMPIAKHYLEAEKLAPKPSDKPAVAKVYETDKAKANSSKASTAKASTAKAKPEVKSEPEPTTAQPVVASEREAEKRTETESDLLDNSLDTLLGRDAETGVGSPEPPVASVALAEPTIEPTSEDLEAEESKKSPHKGVGFDKNRSDWRFRRKIDGSQKTICRAGTHAEIVALKQEWEKNQ